MAIRISVSIYTRDLAKAALPLKRQVNTATTSRKRTGELGTLRLPTGYTWHHTEVVKKNGTKIHNKMELVKTDAHQAARHSGGAQLYRDLTGTKGYR